MSNTTSRNNFQSNITEIDHNGYVMESPASYVGKWVSNIFSDGSVHIGRVHNSVGVGKGPYHNMVAFDMPIDPVIIKKNFINYPFFVRSSRCEEKPVSFTDTLTINSDVFDALDLMEFSHYPLSPTERNHPYDYYGCEHPLAWKPSGQSSKRFSEDISFGISPDGTWVSVIKQPEKYRDIVECVIEPAFVKSGVSMGPELPKKIKEPNLMYVVKTAHPIIEIIWITQ